MHAEERLGVGPVPLRPEAAVQYPGTSFAGGLREIARLIKAEVGLRVATIIIAAVGACASPVTTCAQP